MSYIQISAVPRTPWAEEKLVVPVAGTVVHPTLLSVQGSLMARARLEGGPVRINFLAAPTNVLGLPLYDADIVEWSRPELDGLVTPGGLVLHSLGTADASVWLVYYR